MAPPSRDASPTVGREMESNAEPFLKSSQPERKSPVKDGLHMQRDLQESMSRLDVRGPPASKTLNEQAKTNIKRAGLRLDDDQTHISTTFSTTAPSLDGKSTTSGTTFALDEKESLRPDDSASVQALEDEDCASGPASGAPNSRVGSEAGGRAFRDQLYEISENVGTNSHRSHPLSRKVIEGIEEEGPQSTQTPLLPTIQAQVQPPMPVESAPQLHGSMDLFLHRDPDEKLFEALDSPKDRFFILRLEKQIIEFIKNSVEERMILPPCNSFCRLLAHKLADYYTLTHWVDNAVSAVTLYRTPYCRIPTPLAELAKARTPGSVNISAAPVGMKIMRRPGGTKDSPLPDSGAITAESSAYPSKAGSEAGDEVQHEMSLTSPAESAIAKDKASLSREEREARYREKREELFGPQSEHAESPESTKEVSRASSRNEKKKKKHRKDDDGFEARSAFNAYYPSMQYPVNPFDQGPVSPAFYNPYCAPNGMQLGHPMGQPVPPGAAILPQGYQQGDQSMPSVISYPPAMLQSATMNGYNCQSPQDLPAQPSQSQAFNQQQTPTQYYAQMHQPLNAGQHSSTQSPPPTAFHTQMANAQSQPLEQSQWAMNPYGQSFQQPSQPSQYFPSAAPQMPYPYGQLPFQPGGGKAAHPLPGSYNRSAFNPQTRAFVPGGNGMMSNQYSHPVPFGGQSSPPNVRQQPSSFSNGAQYPTQHASNAFFPPNTSMHASSSYNTNGHVVGTPSMPGRKISNHFSNQQAPMTSDLSGQQSSLSKWGTPANLPPKPPPVDTPVLSEGQHSLPMNNHFGVNLQAPVMHGGQPMPSFQNGIYSMPGVNS